MAIIVPNTASSFASAGCIPSSCNVWAWIGFRTPITASGSATFFNAASPTSGCELLAIAASPGQTQMFGPFLAYNGLYVNGVSGGCALAWLKL